MPDLGARIRNLRERQKITPRELAERCGMAYSTLMDIELGRSRRTLKLHKIAEALGTTANYLETGRDESHVSRIAASRLGSLNVSDGAGEYDAGNYVTLSFLNPKLDLSLGAPVLPSPDHRAAQLQFRRDFIEAEGWSVETHFVLSVDDDAMSPTIQPGARVVIDTSDHTIQSGRVYAIAIDDHIGLARLDRLPSQRIRVRFDNPGPMFAPYELLEADLRLAGRAVWATQTL